MAKEIYSKGIIKSMELLPLGIFGYCKTIRRKGILRN
jgi:hypothetical protein